ncbi:DUF7576 family protein [Halorussus marinus]|uniref:DUF7576 family protein n=1 Tax=Halorussus marinus TaxID=2505976 RepID=UPI00106EC5C6|nr:hypothetical protein [Halorussus marinus]
MSDESIAEACRREAPAPDADRAHVCAVCDEPIDDAERHPVATRIGESGAVVLYLFCSPACRTRWDESSD